MTLLNEDSDVSVVPIWPALIVPVLRVLDRGETLHRKDLFDRAADEAQLSLAARAETLSSGRLRYEHRMGWVLSNASKAGWVNRPSRGHYAINEKGRAWLRANPEGLDYSQAHEVFAPFWPHPSAKAVDQIEDPETQVSDVFDPVEQIEDGVKRIQAEVAEELLQRLRESHPDFFEQAVVDLLLKMGYGGAEQRGRRIGGTSDGGIDGIIDQDALGLDRIYLQAKRYKEGNNVGRETIQAFVGALHGFGASRGIFITTSGFTDAAVKYAANVPSSIILVDSKRLVTLMIKYGVGVQIKQTYTVIDIDTDFFD